MPPSVAESLYDKVIAEYVLVDKKNDLFSQPGVQHAIAYPGGLLTREWERRHSGPGAVRVGEKILAKNVRVSRQEDRIQVVAGELIIESPYQLDLW